jgi:hypothetical protein
MTREGATWYEAVYVLTHANAHSAAEIAASGKTEWEIANHLANVPMTWVAYHDDMPCAFWGAYEREPGLWGLFGFGTADWHLVWRQVTLVSARDMMRRVLDAGAQRADCLSLAENERVHKWLRFLGAAVATAKPGAGANGEDLIQFTWLRPQDVP